MISPDQPYVPTPDELRIYEDTEVARLLAKVPNYYTRSDQTVWGKFLRAGAAEIGRQEFNTAYSLLTKTPEGMSPADIGRSYEECLDIPADYPTAYQSDMEYKEMLVTLVGAFHKGAKVSSLQEVVQAYIQRGLQVEELFKRIGTAGYRPYDRNTLRVATTIDPTGTETKLLTENLYRALDLAKPAHVGLSVHTMFSEIDSMQTLINEIDDSMVKIIVWFVEEEPLEIPLYLTQGADLSKPLPPQYPLKNPTTPETHLGPVSKFFTKGPITLEGLGLQPGGTWKAPLTDGTVIKVAYQDPITDNGYYWARAGKWERYKTPALGVISPVLDRVWEVEDTEPLIIDME